MPASANKIGNEYQEQFPCYDETPKSLIAAVAMSLAMQLTGEEDNEQAKKILSDEWASLHKAGIVPQKPKAPAVARAGSLSDPAIHRLAGICKRRDIPFRDLGDGTIMMNNQRFFTNREAERYLS